MKSKSNPLVSAIITTHNRAELLPRALDSVVVQTYPNIEIIVVDDGSTDNTSDVVESYQQKIPINYIRLDDSVGACRARNTGIEAASGNFVAGLDDDDQWHRKRIEELLEGYSDEYSAVTSDVVMVRRNSTAVWKKPRYIDLESLLYTNLVGNQVLVRRSRLMEVGMFDSGLEAAQDYDLWIRLCEAFGPIFNVQKPLQTIFMDHEEERITSSSSYRGYLQFYEKHKHHFNRAQRKYQLYNIRRAQRKRETFAEFANCVPPFRYWKEFKRIVREKFWG